MPLHKGTSHKVMGENYKAEIKAGKPPVQAKAIMLNEAYGPVKQKHRHAPYEHIIEGNKQDGA